MGKYVITNGKILFNGYDLSGDHNQIGLTVSREEREATTYGKVGVQRLAGLQSFDVSGSGFFEAGDALGTIGAPGHIDTIVAPQLGTSGVELTILPQGSSVGSIGFLSQVNTFEYAPGGSIGDVMGFTFAGKGEGTVLTQGTVLLSGTIPVSGTGTMFNLGAISAGKRGYATLHVTSTSGSNDNQTLDVKVQSDYTTSFASATTRVSFTQVGNAVTSQLASPTTVSTTDIWWRTRWVNAGTGQKFTAYVTFGISNL